MCPLPFRIGMAVAIREDISQYEKRIHRASSAFATEPVVQKWRTFILIFDGIITVCCMPM